MDKYSFLDKINILEEENCMECGEELPVDGEFAICLAESKTKQLEIHNVPQDDEEDFEKTISQIGRKLGVEINKRDIDSIQRIQNNRYKNPKPNKKIKKHNISIFPLKKSM